MIRFIERSLGRAAAWSQRRYRLVLVVAVLATALSVWVARSLRIDTDLTHLLPSTFESVQSLEQLEEKSWGVGYVSLVIGGADVAERRRAGEHLAKSLEALPTIEYVDFKKPEAFFAKRAAYYVALEDLEEARDRIDARHVWEARKRNPMFDLELEPLGDAPSLDMSDLLDKYESPQIKGSAYLEGGDVLVLLAKPSRRSSDVGFNDRVVADVEGLIASTDLSGFDPSLTFATSGRYKKKAEQKAQIEKDLQTASLLALLFIVGYLALHFRRPSAVLLVLCPLVMAIAWTFAITTVVFGSLNLLTGFIGALLLGVGVDHGIHLLSRIDEAGVQKAFGTTGRAVVAAALTTVFAFVGVAVSDFRAFREFGVIASCGLVLTVVAYTAVLPALLAAVGASKHDAADRATSSFARALPRWAPVVGWLALLGAIAGMTTLPQVRFDYDFASLESSDLPAFRLDKRVNELLGRSQTPLLVLADDVEHERAIARALREKKSDTIQLVMSLDDLVPTITPEKTEVIAYLNERLNKAKESWLNEQQRKQRAQLIDATSAAPFSRADLPDEVRRQFIGRDGVTSFVLVYPRVSLSDGAGVQRLASELRAVRLDDGRPLVIAGEAMVLADVLDMVVAETPVVLIATGILVLLVLLMLVGPRLVAPCLLTALTTLLVTAGLTKPLDLSFNYLNIIIVPVLFGMAVDGAVHVVLRYDSERDVVMTVSETGRAVAGAIVTTGLGFGAFMMASHPGLASLGSVAVLGLAVNLLVCLVLLPSWIALLERAQAVRRAGESLWVRLLVTTGFAGDAPVAPGTMGALVALPLGFAAQRLTTPGRGAIAAVAIVGSVYVVARYLRRPRADGSVNKDPSEVVVDELVGCLLAMLMVPHGVVWAVAAFLLFRALDIFKPWPISFIDRRVRGAWGVMGDDILAGVMAGGALFTLNHVAISRGWWS